MGLAVVYGIVKDHGGAVAVHSRPDEGTTFEIYLPRVAAEACAVPEGIGKDVPRGCDRILLVDDEEPIIKLLERALGRLGYRITAVPTGREALERFQAAPETFDLVITDLSMPGMTGLELTARLVGIRPELPVILCTGFGDEATVQRAMAAGIREFVTKPVVIGEIAAAIRRAVKGEGAGGGATAGDG